MQPSLKKIDNNGSDLFQLNKVEELHFYPFWHFHPQCEIMIIEEGSGTLYIGDGITDFQPGDVIILGPNIPHLLRSFPEYFKSDSQLIVKASVIYFNENFLGNEFMNFEDNAIIKQLLNTAGSGMIFTGNATDNIKNIFYGMINKTGFDRMIEFLLLLNSIALNRKYKLLSSIGFQFSFDKKEVNRLNDITDFLLKNFTRTIRLNEVSAIAHMSETAFCRYFKEKTNKTLITFLNEIRIGYACKLLIEKQHLNVSQISDKTGFNNITNFNIQFKKLKKRSPLEYRSLYNLELINGNQ